MTEAFSSRCGDRRNCHLCVGARRVFGGIWCRRDDGRPGRHLGSQCPRSGEERRLSATPRPAAAHLLRPGWPGGGRRSGVAGFVLGGRAQGEKAERREDLLSAFPFSLRGARQVSRPHAAPGSSFENEKLGPHSKPQLARFSSRGGILGNAPFGFECTAAPCSRRPLPFPNALPPQEDTRAPRRSLPAAALRPPGPRPALRLCGFAASGFST